MHYLEDYIELTEHLHLEVRDKLSEIGEIDSRVQHGVTTMKHKSDSLFSRANKLKPDDRDKEYEKIAKEYKKLEDESSEKVEIAEKLYELYNKHLKKLDLELNKFKLELEADNAGITEILEKRSLELDRPRENGAALSHNKSNFGGRQQHPFVFPHKNKSLVSNLVSNATKRINQINKDRKLLLAKNSMNKRRFINNHISTSLSKKFNETKDKIVNLERNFSGIEDEGTSSPSRFSSSSREKFNELERLTSDRARSRVVNKKYIGFADVPPGGASRSFSSISNQTKKRAINPLDNSSFIDPNSITSPLGYGMELEGEEEDPNEPRYCICNQISYGEMVACDNPSCPYEWFHYACVNVTQTPKGKWFCPECSITAVF